MNTYKMNVYKSKETRRDQSINKLKELNIDYIDNLPCTYEVSEVTIKSIDDIAKRYIANIIAIQVAFDILNESDLNDSFSFFYDLLDKYGVRDCLNNFEKKVFDNKLKKEELINLTWQYEAINVLAWVLGLKSELEYPDDLCDVESLMRYIAGCNNYEEFINKCKIIDIEKILDELDLEYRYHWATVEKRVNESTNTNGLDEEIVIERRRALEWLFIEEKDWNNVSLDT